MLSDPSLTDTQQQMPSYGYIPYDAAGNMYSQPPLYNQNVMYVPMSANTSSTATSTEHSPDRPDSKDNTPQTHQAAQPEEPKK